MALVVKGGVPMRIWPIDDSWIVTLYGSDENPPDVLFIGIDDEQGVGFSSHIEPILNVCRHNHPDLSFWFLFLTSATFERWIKATNSFNSFISVEVEKLLYAAKGNAASMGTDVKSFDTYISAFSGLKIKITNAPVKIWLVDLMDSNNNHQDSIALINGLRNQNENCVLFSQQRLDELIRIIGMIDIKNYFQKQLYINDQSIEGSVYPQFSDFIPDNNLKTVLPVKWHQIRHQIGSDANIKVRTELRSCHHWGPDLGNGDCVGGRNSHQQTAEIKWVKFDGVLINGSTLQSNLKAIGYGTVYKKVMFSSQTLRLAIRELLQTCKCGNNLSKYLGRMKEHLEKHGQRLAVKKIEVSIFNNTIDQDYLWFNVVALNTVLRLIINSYEDELNKTAYSGEQKGKTVITFNEIDNGSRKGLEVLVKEDPLIVTNLTFPFRNDSATINEGVIKDILSNLYEYLGVDNISYKANGECRIIDIGCVLSNNSRCTTPDGDPDDFTFKWLIEAQDVNEPYKCAFMPEQDGREKCWTIKKGYQNAKS